MRNGTRLLLALGLLGLVSCGRTVRTVSSTPTVWDLQVKNAVRSGEGDEMLRALRTHVLANPQDVAARRRLADRYLAAGYRDLSIEHLRLALAQTPADESLALDLARQLAAENLPGEAAQVLEAFHAKPRASATLLSYAAILADEQSDFSAGERLHRAALDTAPNNRRLKNNLAFNLARQKRAAESASLFQEILRAEPSFEAARNNLAYLYATQLNQPEEALLHWKAVSGPAVAHNNLAATYLELGRDTEARRELEKALAIRFQFPEAQKNLQILAARTGGTVELNLDRDKRSSGLSKLAKAIRHVFVSDAPSTLKE